MVTDIERNQDFKRWWEIHDKDTYVCPDCERTLEEHGRRWEVHHLNGEAHNCVALCQSCHKVRHGAIMRNVELEAWKEDFLAHGRGESVPE